MFHIKFPKFRGFFTWDELGCLARGLGFPMDLFRDNLADVIEPEEHGLSLKEVYKMLDYRLLEGALHRTQNLHTAEWNMKAVRKSLTLLDHRAITFEDLYNTRVAYQAYEAFDMKGMHLDQHTLLCTLRMCRRSIAPMKLAHRIKHMKGEFEERGRIQLYEFLDLVLWCGVYEKYSPDDIEIPDGKERDLFVLVDFEKLLSHHDQRLADRLNAEYLQEEWDFGRENLGSRKMFKEPPVKCAEDRIKMARTQKRLYRGLKAEVYKSQKSVYRSKAGFVRERPLTAPNLSMYAPKQPEEEPPTFTAHNAYEIMQRKVKSAKTRDVTTSTDTSDRPQYTKAEEVDRPRVISEGDVQDAKQKFQVLEFDIATMDSRLQQVKDDVMEAYYPGYRERELAKQEEVIEINLQPRPKSASPAETSRSLASEEAINRLAYPDTHLSPSHAKTCDARFRGWHGTKTKAGEHFVLVSPSFENSYKGRLHQKMSRQNDIPVQHIKGDILYRKTKKSEVKKGPKGRRPSTAPAALQNTQKEKSLQKDISPADSCKTVDTGYNSSGDSRPSLVSSQSLIKNDSSLDSNLGEELSPSQTDMWYRRGDMLRVPTMDLLESGTGGHAASTEDTEAADTEDIISSVRTDKSEPTSITKNSTNYDSSDINTDKEKRTQLKFKKKHAKERGWISPDELAPVPQMEHSKPKPVPVGGIGVISLLESISESKYWEEVCDKEQMDESTTDEESSDTKSEGSVDSGQGEDIELTLSLLKKRLHTQPKRPTQKSRKQQMMEKFNKQMKESSMSHKGKETVKENVKLERPKSESSAEVRKNDEKKQHQPKTEYITPYKSKPENKRSFSPSNKNDKVQKGNVLEEKDQILDNKENECISFSNMVSPNSSRSEHNKSRGSMKSTSDYGSLGSSKFSYDKSGSFSSSDSERKALPTYVEKNKAKMVTITLSKLSLQDGAVSGKRDKASHSKVFRLVKRAEGAISTEMTNRLLMTSQV